MAEVNGVSLERLSGGCSVSNGREICLGLQLTNGVQQQEMKVFISHEQIAPLISYLIMLAGVARRDRIASTTDTEGPGSLNGGLALMLSRAIPGQAIAGDVSVLRLQFDAGNNNLLNIDCAADAAALDKLHLCVAEAKAMMSRAPAKPSVN
ncbi:MAG TPA: hypothetical protein VG735_06140 [Caulobacterales bacterium]|nr:hypothetical protein [Caulobacterales bacterium]